MISPLGKIQSQPDNLFFVGVDVGGTNITTLVVNSHLQMLAETTRPTDLSSPEDTIESIKNTVFTSLNDANVALEQVTAVGVGIPGRVEPSSGLVQLAVNLKWDNMPAGQLLSEAFDTPCYLENDVRIAALGSYHFLANRSVQNMAYVSVGTGVAAGLVINGLLYRGSTGMAGEIGHLVIDPEGLRCNCGNHGCLEMYTSGPAIVRAGKEAMMQQELFLADDVKPVTAVDVFEAAKTGNQAALKIVKQAGAYLGRGLQILQMTYDVDLIFIGGGVSRGGEIYRQAILQEWRRQALFSPLAADMLNPSKLQLTPPTHNSGAWGGVALALNNTAESEFQTAVS